MNNHLPTNLPHSRKLLLLVMSLLSIQGALVAMDAAQTLSSGTDLREARRAAICLAAQRHQETAGQNTVARVRSNPTLIAASMQLDETVSRQLEFGISINYPKGTIKIQNIKYATPPYQYSCDGGQTFQGSPIFENMKPREYHIHVKDSTGNHSEKTIHMDEKHRDDANEIKPLRIKRVSCSPNMFVIIARGGKQPYTFSCDGGETYQDSYEFRDRAAGNYHILVKDADGKIVDKLYTLIEFTLENN